MKRILLVFTLVLALVVVSAGCGSGSSDESKIESTVKGFINALNDGDFDKIFDYVAGGSEMSDAEKAAAEQGFQLYKQLVGNSEITVKSVDDVEVDGNNATAKVVFSFGGQDSEPTELSFVKEDGSWKLSASSFTG